MLYSISWMVTREPASGWRRTYRKVATMFAIGGLAGGALVGAIVSVPATWLHHASAQSPRALWLTCAVLSFAYLGSALHVYRLPKLQAPHQVPQAWRDIFSAPVAAFVYAAGLGTVYFTRLATFAAYGLLALLLGLGAHPVAVIEVGAMTGLVRAMTALILPFVQTGGRSTREVVLPLMSWGGVRTRSAEPVVLLALVALPLAALLTQ